ncbi:MAG TPA: RNA methyltransferase [Acidimicrobiales bacterium]|nr:RNA methyltransferase [Acidimicrobiales bacterium]
MTDLVSVRHPSVQRLRRLSGRRSARSGEGSFVVDGPTLLADALDAGVAVDEVVAEPGCPDDLLARAVAAGAVVRRVANGVLARVTDTVTPQPVAAIARFVDAPAADAAAAAGPLALVLVGVGDPGNAGTLLRSAEAAGAGAVLFCDRSVDPYGPKCVRASAGSVFRLAVTRSADAGDALDRLAAAGLTTVATLARGAEPYDRADLAHPVALILGSEAHGLPEALANRVAQAVTIPMVGRTESLNVGMAGTVLCFESLRQRRQQGNRLDGAPPQAAGCSEA